MSCGCSSGRGGRGRAESTRAGPGVLPAVRSAADPRVRMEEIALWPESLRPLGPKVAEVPERSSKTAALGFAEGASQVSNSDTLEAERPLKTLFLQCT